MGHRNLAARHEPHPAGGSRQRPSLAPERDPGTAGRAPHLRGADAPDRGAGRIREPGAGRRGRATRHGRTAVRGRRSAPGYRRDAPRARLRPGGGHRRSGRGIHWPELMAWLESNQRDAGSPWGIRQKQTGADRISIGGTLSANAHGRGLTLKPFVDDVESFTLLGADGVLRSCSRDENRELFSSPSAVTACSGSSPP